MLEPGDVASPPNVPDALANVHEAVHVSFREIWADPSVSYTCEMVPSGQGRPHELYGPDHPSLLSHLTQSSPVACMSAVPIGVLS